MITRSMSPSADLPGTAPPLAAHERGRMLAAAGHASRVFPGALGELVARELTAYAEFGHRFGADDLIARLAATVLALPSDHRNRP